jgi:replicative DNA helicase
MSNELFSLYPETAVLSLFLQKTSVIDKYSHFVTPTMFSSAPNKNLYDFLVGMRRDGLFLDYGLVVSRLQEGNKLAECGGEAYLKYLTGLQVEESNIEEYIRFTANSYKARELLTVAGNIPRLITDIANVDNVISHVKLSLDNLNVSSGDGIIDMKAASVAMWDELVSRINNPNKIQYTTGVSKLDLVTGGYFPGDVWVIAGRPGMGKSSFLCNSVLTGIPSMVFSLEMSKLSIVQRLVSIKSGVPVFNMRLGQLDQKQLDQVARTITETDSLPIFIDTKFATSMGYVSSMIRRYVKSNDVKIVHIDYLQLLAERSNDATNELGRITRECKLLAQELDITMVLYSQLNRMVELREDKRPVLSDLRQSGNVEEDVDNAVFLYRDVLYNPNTKLKGVLELLIRKQRNGPVGVITTRFVDQTNKIEDNT